MRQLAVDLGACSQEGDDFVAVPVGHGGEKFRRSSSLAVLIFRLVRGKSKLESLLDEESFLVRMRQLLAPEFFRQGKFRRGCRGKDERCRFEDRRSWCG